MIYRVASLEKAFSLASIAGSVPFTGILCSHCRHLSQPSPSQTPRMHQLIAVLQGLLPPSRRSCGVQACRTGRCCVHDRDMLHACPVRGD